MEATARRRTTRRPITHYWGDAEGFGRQPEAAVSDNARGKRKASQARGQEAEAEH